MVEAILSTLAIAPTSDFVYSSLSFVGRRRGGALPGSWFVDALAPFGVTEAAVRQTLYRMERSGELVAQRAGRAKLYAPSATTRAIMDTGRARMFDAPEREWDGSWTVVHFRFPADEWRVRDRLRDVLMVGGFGALDPGLYLHARDRTARAAAAARDLGAAERLFIVRGPRHAPADDERLVRELWDLPAVASRYDAFLERYADIDAARLDPLEAFGIRYAAVFEFFRISWDDPQLPPALLPRRWPGERARRRIAALHRRLEAPALRHADSVLTARALTFVTERG